MLLPKKLEETNIIIIIIIIIIEVFKSIDWKDFDFFDGNLDGICVFISGFIVHWQIMWKLKEWEGRERQSVVKKKNVYSSLHVDIFILKLFRSIISIIINFWLILNNNNIITYYVHRVLE